MVRIAALKGSSNFRPNASSTPNKSHKHGPGGGFNHKPHPQKRRASWIEPEQGDDVGRSGKGQSPVSPAGSVNGRPAKKMRKKAHGMMNGAVAEGSRKPLSVREQRQQLPIAQGASLSLLYQRFFSERNIHRQGGSHS